MRRTTWPYPGSCTVSVGCAFHISDLCAASSSATTRHSTLSNISEALHALRSALPGAIGELEPDLTVRRLVWYVVEVGCCAVMYRVSTGDRATETGCGPRSLKLYAAMPGM
ncbi:hypothetical protein NDU88_005016 [Pleurodeles waltl]|uniref:Uncharacterized protein n=1 Tax=Pleurodeles waltl TaxID=8319 RepID=A0AAV7SKJ7_PLEWA|nr:hypothetical protein NDU88_005016 [Pleurodeles waltl]